MKELSEAADKAQQALDKENNEEQEFKKAEEQAELTEDELKVALKQQIGQGLVTVDKKEDKVIVDCWSWRSIPSGQQNLLLKLEKLWITLLK